MKTCRICNKCKSDEAFRKHALKCRKCEYAERKDYHKKQNAKYSASHKEEKRARDKKRGNHWKEYRKTHPDVGSSERFRAWGETHPEEKRVAKLAIWHRRRARKLANGGTFSPAQWQELKIQHDYTCVCCGRREPDITLTIDHVVPVSLGGSNSIDNIQPLCGACNSRKKDRVADYRSRQYEFWSQMNLLVLLDADNW